MKYDDLNDEPRIPNGIELCEDKCQCGGNLRLHTFTFKTENGDAKTKHYIDCTNPRCECVTGWHPSIQEAIEAFDNSFHTP